MKRIKQAKSVKPIKFGRVRISDEAIALLTIERGRTRRPIWQIADELIRAELAKTTKTVAAA